MIVRTDRSYRVWSLSNPSPTEQILSNGLLVFSKTVNVRQMNLLGL